MEWSNDVILAFISEIETLPILWDTKDPFYKITRKKNDAWETLAKTFGTTESEVKKKWQSLQASYRREKAREIKHSGMGSDEVCQSGWFAYAAMHFIRNRYKPRLTTNTSQVTEDGILDDTIEEGTEQSAAKIDEVEIPDLTTTSEPNETLPSTSKKRTKEFPAPKLLPPKKKVKEDPRIDEVYNILKKTVGEKNVDKDEYEIYGDYVVSKLKTLDNHSYVMAQYYINQILFEAQLGRYKEIRGQQQMHNNAFVPLLSPTSTQDSDSSNTSRCPQISPVLSPSDSNYTKSYTQMGQLTQNTEYGMDDSPLQNFVKSFV